MKLPIGALLRRVGTDIMQFSNLSYWNRSAAQTLPVLLLTALAAGGCQPTVRVEAPQEPITINLNVKLDADVRVKLEEQAQQDIDKNDDIF